MPEPDRQPSTDPAAPVGPSGHGLRRVSKAPASTSAGPWPTTGGWPSRERTDPRRPWGLAEDLARPTPERAKEPAPEPTPEPTPVTLEDTPIFGDLQARWLARTAGRPDNG